MNNSDGKNKNIRRASSKEVANFAAQKYANSRKIKDPVLFGLFYKTRSSAGAFKFGVNYKRCALFFVLAFILGWFSLSVASYCFYKYMRDFSTISFVQVAKAPWARAEMTKALGEYNIELAKKHFEDEKWSSGLDLLYKGVARSPENLEARLMLAQINASWFKNYEDSAKILYQKIKEAFIAKNSAYVSFSIPMFMRYPEYKEDAYSIMKAALSAKIVESKDLLGNMSPLLAYLSETRDFLSLVEICQKCAKIAKAYDADLAKFFAVNGAYAYSSLFDHVAAIDILEAYGIAEGAIYSQAMSQKMWSQGEEAQAIKIMESILSSAKEKAGFYSVLKNYYKEMDCPKSSKYAERMEYMLGEIYDPVVYSIKTEYLLGNEGAAVEHVKKFMANYGKDPAAVAKLQSTIFELGSKLLMDQILSAGVELSDSQKVYARTSEIEVMIRQGFSKDAASALESLRFSSGKAIGEHALTGYDIAIMLISDNISSAMDSALNFLSRDFENSGNILWVSEMLKRVGQIGMSQFVAQEGLKKFPQDRRIIRSLILSYAKTGNFAEMLKLMSRFPMRYPIEAVKAFESQKTLSDKFIFIDQQSGDKTLKSLENIRQRIIDYKSTNFKD